MLRGVFYALHTELKYIIFYTSFEPIDLHTTVHTHYTLLVCDMMNR